MTVNHTVTVTEHRSSLLADAWVRAVDPSFWVSAGLAVTRSPGQEDWTVSAGSLVGVARTKTDIGYLTVHVAPKLRTCDVFFLADYAFGQRHQSLRELPGATALLEEVRSDPAAAFLLWHIEAIHGFGARWLRRDQLVTTTTLNGKVKGSLQLGKYVAQHLARADAATIPVRLRRRTLDTPNNRILKAGLRRALILAQCLPVPAARAAVRSAAIAALPIYSQITDVAGTPADFRHTSSRGPLRRYADVLRTSKALLQERYPGTSPGELATPSFLWSMPTLFQEALRGVLTTHCELTLTPDVASATIFDPSDQRLRASKVDPDFVATTPSGQVLLMDAKYKDAMPSPSATPSAEGEEILVIGNSQRRIRVPRADIYQMAAYRQHDHWPNSQGALLYPVELAAGEPLPGAYEIRGFGPPIYICFMDVSPTASNNLGAFARVIDDVGRR